jgi:YkoY family integral membrane protein
MIENVITILFLVFMEGMLSFDNALVLAVLTKKLPQNQQKKALTYGIWGAIGFRLLALSVLTFIMQSFWVKFAGAGYLFYLSAKHFMDNEDEEDPRDGSHQFWKTILLVELTDIAFSVDSILASVAVSDQLWIVFAGGLLGIVMMRFAAILFIKLISFYPKLERSAYLLVGIVAVKLFIEGSLGDRVDFHSTHQPYLWTLWAAIIGAFVSGFLPDKKRAASSA